MNLEDLLGEYRKTQRRQVRNLRASSWYRITNKAAGPAQVMIYDEIGAFGITAADFISDLDELQGDVELHLNTPGGLVFEGLTIYNALKQRQGQVSVVIDGLAASIGSVIAQAASPGKLKIAPSAAEMIHDGYGPCVGNQAEMEAMARLLGEASDNIANIYAGRSGRPAAQWREAMKAETWYYGQKAVDAGLADSLLDDPGAALENHLTNAAVDESAWDAARAWAAGAASDDPAAFYDAICAGRKAGDPATQAAHALPHHYRPGDPPNRHGVSAALGRLPGTQGLTNEAAARAHLEAHSKAMGSGTSDHHDGDLHFDAELRRALEEAFTR